MTTPAQPSPGNVRAIRINLGPDPNDPRPNAARIHNYLLGGHAHFAADRAAAAQLSTVVPQAIANARANRAFLVRAVRYLVVRGVHQFIELGVGLSLDGGLHETAHAIDSTARLVYVDHDVVVTDYIREQLADTPHVAVLRADLRDPASVLASAEVLDLLDLTKPVGLLASAVLHYVSGLYQPGEILAHYRAALAPGSHLVLSHATLDDLSFEQVSGVLAVYQDTTTPLTLRTSAEITALFDGWILLRPADDTEPAVVPVTHWRWTDDLTSPVPDPRDILGGVGYLPTPDTTVK